MSNNEIFGHYLEDLRRARENFLLLEQRRPPNEDFAALAHTIEITTYDTVISAADGLAQVGIPEAAQFALAYKSLLREVSVTFDDDMQGVQLGHLDESRRTNLRPAALFMLDSFLYQLTPGQAPVGVIGGGPERKPLGAFLDLVRTVHARRGEIKKVLLTDRYLFAGRSADIAVVNYADAIAFLQAVGLSRETIFSLDVTPAPRNSLPNAFTIFKNYVLKFFPYSNVGRHNTCCTFHDRLYLTLDSSGHRRGIFGPSLNGLGASDIVIMGQIEAQDLTLLSNWLAF
ncbi:MAG TPA: hypothetical protein VN851_26765 [Thermoanaerobaculia bacterium]|nr:hypothetical protein [Thermoanaerobaculia bacterium]